MPSDTWQFELARWWPLGALVLLPVVVYYSRGSLVRFARWQRNLSSVVRCVLLGVLAVALCGPRVTWPGRERTVVFAVDRSTSIPDEGSRTAAKYLDECKGLAGEVRVVELPFAARPVVLQPTDDPGDEPPADADASDLAAAIATASALVPGDRVARVVLLSDGRPTAGDALAAARAAPCPVDVVPLPGRPKNEVYVGALSTPGQARAGEPFYLKVGIYSSGENRGKLGLKCDGAALLEETVSLTEGENRFRFPQVVTRAGPATFTAELAGFEDTLPQNNTARAVVFATPRARVLLVESRPALAEPLSDALGGENLDVEVRAPEAMPSRLEEFEPYELVILSDVPATALSDDRMEGLRRYVRDFGGGLIVVGGERAFTPGGYKDTVLEEILPVRPHVRTDRPKPSVALVLVLDRSGSMEGQSIELAKQATRRAIENLTPRDQVGVVAFEDRPHWISRIGPVADKAQVLKRIDTIAAGGGTNMVPAMEQAYLALDEAYAQRKHIIVLTDGLSHPGDFSALTRRIAGAGITVSTVAVGPEAAGQVLRDVATVGGGNYYQCEDATAVPRIFALETIAAGKRGICEEPFVPQVVEPSRVLAGIDFGRVKPLLGYAETQLKPTAQLVLASEDGDPLLAWWRYGAGTTAVFTSDVQSRWAAAWLRWEGFGRFWAQLVRQVMRRDPLRDFSLRARWHGGRAAVTLDAVDPEGRFVNAAEGTLSVIDPKEQTHSLPLAQAAPGRYAADFPAEAPGVYYFEAALEYQGQPVYLARRGLAVDWPDELRVGPANTALLQSIAEASGGNYDPLPAEVFAPDGRTAPRTFRLWPPLLVCVLLLLVVDVALKRKKGSELFSRAKNSSDPFLLEENEG